MALLRYYQDNCPIEVTLDTDDITIGRSESAIITIKSDPEISRVHCAVQRGGNGSFVVLDAASRNGTYLNGVRLMDEAVALAHGDRLRIGHTEMVFYDGEIPEPKEMEPRKPVSQENVFEEIARELEDGGKGFHTLMHEIIEDPLASRKSKRG